MSEPDWITEAKALVKQGQHNATVALHDLMANRSDQGLRKLKIAVGELVEASAILLDHFIEQEQAPELFPDGMDDGEEAPASAAEWRCETCGLAYPCH